MIEDSVMIHDKFQFQVKLTYDVDEKKKDTEYHVDTFIFLPKSFGINSNSYASKDFYNDTQTFIRYKTPVHSLKELASGIGPLTMLKKGEDIEFHLKLFCCIVKSAIRDAVKSTSRFDAKAYVAHVEKVRDSFRAIDVPLEHAKAYALCDEDFSLIIRSYTFMQINKLPKGDDRDALIGLVSHEEEHRRERKYPSIPSKEGKNEYFLSRKNNLKKYVESSLYLKTSEGKEGKVLETIFSGIAAGLAMVFATAITFIAQVKFGNFTTSFFVALVLGYIFKDTIKVSLKSYLKYTSKKNLFDRKTKVYADEKNIGIIKESFDFELEKDLHKSVLILKSKDAIDDIDVSMSDETILKYSKKIRLLTNELRMKGYTVGAINDISRINIKRYITKMSDPAKVIDYLDGGKVVSIEGEMVYHIDIIMRFISGEKIMYKRLRLVLNRDGIKNIEEVDSKQEDIKEKMNWESMMKHIPVKIHFPKV